MKTFFIISANIPTLNFGKNKENITTIPPKHMWYHETSSKPFSFIDYFMKSLKLDLAPEQILM